MNSAPNVAGELSFLSLAGTLKDLFQRRATGELVLSRGDAVKKIFLKNGVIIFATSNQNEDRLGDVLLAQGLINRGQYDESSRQMQATGKKQGTLLVQMEALSPKDLFRGLNLQVSSIVLSCFGWDGGSYAFSDTLPPQEEIVTLRILPAPLIVMGILKHASETDAFGALWDPEKLSLTIHPDPPWVVEDLRLPAAAKKLFECVAKEVPWMELPAAAGMGRAETGALLYALHVLELVVPGEAAAPAAAERKEHVPRPETALPSPENIDSLFEKLHSLNLYQILRLEPAASGEAVKQAYLTLAKEYHPDRFFDSRYENRQSKITSIFMRINEAYSVLTNSKKRSEYDRKEIHLQPSRQEKAAEGDSRVAQNQYRKGMASLKGGDLWTAVESFRWAVQLSPRNALYHSWLGAALTGTRKRLHEAEEHCKTAIALDYSNPLFYLHLGRVYKTGRLLQKARQQFETALKLDPSFRQAREELDQLGSEKREKGFMGKILGK